jgi:hypothetical protein
MMHRNGTPESPAQKSFVQRHGNKIKVTVTLVGAGAAAGMAYWRFDDVMTVVCQEINCESSDLQTFLATPIYIAGEAIRSTFRFLIETRWPQQLAAGIPLSNATLINGTTIMIDCAQNMTASVPCIQNTFNALSAFPAAYRWATAAGAAVAIGVLGAGIKLGSWIIGECKVRCRPTVLSPAGEAYMAQGDEYSPRVLNFGSGLQKPLLSRSPSGDPLLDESPSGSQYSEIGDSSSEFEISHGMGMPPPMSTLLASSRGGGSTHPSQAEMVSRGAGSDISHGVDAPPVSHTEVNHSVNSAGLSPMYSKNSNPPDVRTVRNGPSRSGYTYAPNSDYAG